MKPFVFFRFEFEADKPCEARTIEGIQEALNFGSKYYCIPAPCLPQLLKSPDKGSNLHI